MTARTVFFAPSAEEDVRGAFLWYNERNRAAARAFRAEVYEMVESIAAGSYHLAPDESGVRRRSLKRYPYSVLYRLEEDRLTVVAVAHQRRRPGYWR